MEREYIAFISYRHTPVDREAAVTLQRLIERYRIPKALRRDGEPHLGTIFRDTDELNVSPDLSQSLCTAMDHSEYMIAICSPQYKESAWCREEISYFLKHHDIDHVLPVLVSGEPADAFPEELWRRSVVEGEETVSEPLAANVAGKTVKEMRQNIKREYLRLVAGILGCHYDDLVQRQRRYERRRGAVAIGAVFAVLLAFIGMLLVKNAQINARYQEARENQARYLSTIALEQYGEGDAKSALESILTVLPEGKEKGPVVPEQMYALATVLNAYNNSYVPENYISLPKNDRKVFSENGKNLFSYTSDQLEVYDADSGEICYTFRPNKFFGEGTSAGAEFSNAGRAVIENVVPEESKRFFIQLNGDIFEFDINDPAYYRRVVSAKPDWPDCVCYAQGMLAFGTSEGAVLVYDCVSGELLYETDFNSGEDTAVQYSVGTLAWNEDASMLAVGLNYSNTEIQTSILRDDPELNRQEEEYFQKNPPLGLVLIDPLSSEMKKVSSRRTMELTFAGDAVGAVHKKYPPYIAASNSYTGPSAIWTAAVYDATSGENIYLSDPVLGETHNSFGFSQGRITVDNRTKSVYSLWMGKTGIVLDAENGNILGTENFHSDIADMEYHRDANIMAILSSGSLQMIAFSDSEYLRTNVMKLDIEVEDAAKSGDNYYLLANTGVIQCGLSRWEDAAAVTAVLAEETGLKDHRAVDFRYLDTAQGTLRLVFFGSDVSERDNHSALALYPCLSDEVLFSYASDDPDSEIKACYAAKDGTHISILEKKSDDSVFVSRFSLPDGTLKFCHQLISETMSYDAEAGFSEDGKMLWITRQDTVHFYDLDGNDICLTEYQTDDRIACPTLTEDGRYLIWLERDTWHEKRELVMLRVETGEIERTALPEQFYGKYSFDATLLLGQNGLVVLYDAGREILLYDSVKAEFLEPISVPSGSEIALLGNKSELLVAHDETVSLYDLSTGQRESTLAIPCVVDHLVTDTGSDAFAVYRGGSYSSGNDDGWTTGGYYMISADEARNMYLTAFISGLNANAVSPSGGEIVEKTSEGFEFTQILDFEQLLEIASRR